MIDKEKMLPEIDLERVGGGRPYTPREIENLIETQTRAYNIGLILQQYNRNDDYNKLWRDFNDAYGVYDRSVGDGSIEPDSMMFSEFFEKRYGWPS